MPQSYRVRKNSVDDEFWVFPTRGKTGFYFHSFLPEERFSCAYSHRGKILLSLTLGGSKPSGVFESALPFSAVVDSQIVFYLCQGQRRFGLRFEAGKKIMLYEILEQEGRLIAEGPEMPASFSSAFALEPFSFDDAHLRILAGGGYLSGQSGEPTYAFRGNPFFYPLKGNEGLGVWFDEDEGLEGGYFAKNRILLYGLRIDEGRGEAGFVNSVEGYDFFFSAKHLRFRAPGVDCTWEKEGTVLFNGVLIGRVD